MELKRGQVVRSKAGRDQGSFMAVLGAEPQWAVLADGRGIPVCGECKGRPLERPKRKNIRHISPTLTVLPEEALATNRKLRAALREAGGQRENIPAEV